MDKAPPETDIIFTIRLEHKAGRLAELLGYIGDHEGLIGDITTLFVGKTHSLREITVAVYDATHLENIKKTIQEECTSAELVSARDPVFEKHKGGKLHSSRREDIEHLSDLRYIYTPGVARVCKAIHEEPARARELTNIGNSVGIFTNGTRVLGLGDIGPEASMPVMEGKAVIYDQFVGISATPILIDTKDPDEFITAVERVAPTFGGIHLEDIRVPDAFYIEDELKKRLNTKPVMHDDQHGTGTVTLAAVMSICRLTGFPADRGISVAQIGLGAAGFGIASLLVDWGAHVLGVDPSEQARKRFTDYGGTTAELEEALRKSRIVVTTTGVVGLIKPEMIQEGQIILALSNPIAEISPEEALAAGAAFASDGKSINNALAYPGLFRAALDTGAPSINSKMKIAAAEVISNHADEGELVPSPFHPTIHADVIAAVKGAIG